MKQAGKVPVTKAYYHLLLLFCLALFLIPGQAAAKAGGEHQIYFEGTDYELHVFEIKGEFPGNTLLIIGGMHNEPGGYLSADLYADLSLHQGNLIVVPRANFPAIVSNKRGHHSDMNRKFVNGNGKKKHSKDEYEESVVAILMELISRSDALLNLHDGSGFYRPVWEGKMKNPLRWGQSIISDTDVHVTPDGRTLNLQERINKVIAKVNPQVTIKGHKFHHNNTRTFEKDSPHREQQGSATYYALVEHGIESYGVETSKSIRSLDQKVQYQSLIINAFMDEYNIIPRNPGVAIKDPILEYLLVSVNGGFPYGIPNNNTLKVNYGDKIRIEHIAANYERGLLADIKGLGSLNDMNKEFSILKPHSIQVMKDQFQCGQVFVEVLPPAAPAATVMAKVDDVNRHPMSDVAPPAPEKQASLRPRPDEQKTEPSPLEVKGTQGTHIDEFLILVNDELVRIRKGETLDVSPMDTLVIQDITPAYPENSPLRINFVGFVGNKKINDAEDRGYKIRPRSLWKRFSVDKNGALYRIEALYREEPVGEMFVRILSSSSMP